MFGSAWLRWLRRGSLSRSLRLTPRALGLASSISASGHSIGRIRPSIPRRQSQPLGETGIIGVSLRRPDTARSLLPQDCLYTVETLGAMPQYRIVGTLQRVLTADRQSESVEAALAADDVHIVTLTV